MFDLIAQVLAFFYSQGRDHFPARSASFAVAREC